MKNIYLLLSLLFIFSNTKAFSQLQFFDVRGERVDVIDTPEVNSNLPFIFLSPYDGEPFTGTVFAYYASVLFSQICVKNGVWTNFQELYYYNKHFQDTVAVIKYNDVPKSTLYTQKRKNERTGRQLSTVFFYGEKIKKKYRFYQRNGVVYVRALEYINDNKVKTKRLKFKEASTFKSYLVSNHKYLEISLNFLEEIHFFDEFYTPYSTGCLGTGPYF